MKRKIFVLFFIVFAITQNVFADENYISKDIDTVYGWTMRNTGYENDVQTGLDDTFSIVEDTVHGNVLMVAKQSTSHYNSWKGVIQKIPAEKLISGHTYVAEFDLKMSNDRTWLRTGFNYPKGYSEPYGPNCTNWSKRNQEYTYESGDSLDIIFCNTGGVGTFWLGNVTVYDKDDEEKENLLINGDFSLNYSRVENLKYSDGVVSWDLPEDMRGDKLNFYKRTLDGTRILLNEKPISAEIGRADFEISAENSFYLDAYTCDGDVETDAFAVYEYIGNIDFYDYKLYHGTTQISAPEKGTLTVALPVKNNLLTEGYNFEIIALLKEGNITKQVVSKNYTVPVTEDVSEYTVDMDVDYDVSDNTHIEIYLWDSISDMNIIRDVYVF